MMLPRRCLPVIVFLAACLVSAVCSTAAEERPTDNAFTVATSVQAVVPGPVAVVGIPWRVGGMYRFGEGELGLGVTVLQSDKKDLLTFNADEAFVIRRDSKTLVVSSLTGSGKLQVLPSGGLWVLVPALGSSGEFPSRGSECVTIPFRTAPNVPLLSLRKHLASDDWLSRACAAWAIGERGYKDAAPLLIEALRKETHWYAACYEAAAVWRLGDEKVFSELEAWLAARPDTPAGKRMRDEVTRVLKSPDKGVPQATPPSSADTTSPRS